eukprot:CAMPEP_0168718630 /NCGR_PEP_ID=MMETSP0724-20121128/620_1 /TAXON_ID=265536 /ORGANISM="Amphiprora sp., Strain CCMP467" /LENGTH=561 /DNA_ID=CAMNT_0008765155 /DNA_START=95 /DNA_END=1780 /DNA_ORIENTATION=+
MGRIIVFTSHDLNSQQLLKALQKRNLPYDEISLTDRPSRTADLESLVGAAIVPQLFIHTRHVGGLERGLKELKRWDHSARFDTPLAKYEAEVLPLPEIDDDDDDRLAPNAGGYRVVDSPPAPIQPHTVIKLVTGKTVPLREATELLKAVIPPMEAHKVKGTTHRNCFAGKDLIRQLQKQVDESESQCLRFVKRLLEAGILHPVGQHAHRHRNNNNNHHEAVEFQNTSKDYYRLQCYEAPEILNTYRLWPNTRRNCVTVVEDLAKRLTTVELTSLDDTDGLLDYQKARQNPEWHVFEDAVCELQQFDKNDIHALSGAEVTALVLNIYNIMQRYSLVKVGVPVSHSDRQHCATHVKFNVAGEIYTLKEWVELVRGHGGGGGKSKHFAKIRTDCRNLFALHMGAHSGSTWSPPFQRFTAQHLSDQLDQAAAAFCSEERNVAVRRKDAKVELVALFKQYHGDFSRDDRGLLATVRKYATARNEVELGKILDDKESFKIVYHDPELGCHVSAGPWYNAKELGLMHSMASKKSRRRPSSGGSKALSKDPLGGSEHSMSSNHSNYSWR